MNHWGWLEIIRWNKFWSSLFKEKQMFDNPFEKKEEVVAEEKQEQLSKEPEAKKLTKKQQILRQFGGLVSNIPINHPYWKMKK